MPMLAKIICEDPRVGSCQNGESVLVEVLSSGQVIEKVAFSPHVALVLSEALRKEALRLISAHGGAEIVAFREAEGG